MGMMSPESRFTLFGIMFLAGPIDRPAKPGGFSLPLPPFPAETVDC
jgi:hypothetical protein